ncbi:MAG: DRTGG domain-containing protein [Clostridia bacterium]
MTIREVATLLSADVLNGEDLLDTNIVSACGSDMMSDVLAMVKDQAVLLTGLANPQVVRTALMMDMKCVCFVRGKLPDDKTIQLAKENNIILLTTKEKMFTACGKLYSAGIIGGM